ncbi:MFS transporter [Sphingomonas hylomeconis]|uniref:MFS transporter n=1 Tax=Sphingomonas hylomeconis TaxID=1395958 RepID=UPI0021BA9067|nr:MFS transporter [Sphingomonas hylomeconis]
MVTGLPHRRATGSLVLFASGDFAFNLFWQSISLYLLFFYIDVLALPPLVAGLVFMAGTVWDGIADLIAGAVAERTRLSYRRLVGWGALPLGLAFVAMFAVPMHAAVWVLLAQMLCRTLYAFTNIPYSAWTTRLSDAPEVRTLLAGLRMMFGAAAAALVALGLPVLAARYGYPGAAAVLAMLGVPLLVLVARRVPEPQRARTGAPASLAGQLRALLRNRAFVTLNIAAASGGAAAALLGQSVPYYYRYVVADPAGGPHALAAMGVASAVILPLWTLLATRIGARAAWLIAALIGLIALGLFAWQPLEAARAALALLVVTSIAFAGFNLAAWALLPATVDWGGAQRGVRVEALAFGAFAFVQKIALAIGGLAIGAVYDASGFVAGAAQAPAVAATIRWLMLGGPALLIALSLAAMLAHPLRRHTLAELRRA